MRRSLGFAGLMGIKTITLNTKFDFLVFSGLQGLLTGLLGNLSLLSYFAEKKERGATIVQAVGVLSTLIVLLQLAIAGTMPVPVFTATAVAVVVGFVVNILNFNGLLSAGIYRAWKEAITVGGVSVLPQVCLFFWAHTTNFCGKYFIFFFVYMLHAF